MQVSNEWWGRAMAPKSTELVYLLALWHSIHIHTCTCMYMYMYKYITLLLLWFALCVVYHAGVPVHKDAHRSWPTRKVRTLCTLVIPSSTVHVHVPVTLRSSIHGGMLRRNPSLSTRILVLFF